MGIVIPERLAVFVDGENIPADLFDKISSQAKTFGDCLVWKVFGDFGQNGHGEWLNVCRKNGLQPMLELPSESGKNSTDIAIVVAAMDLLISSAVDALVLVSDDRDFLPLIRRLRASGMNVHGMGRKEENASLCRFHTSWTQIQLNPVARIAAHKIAVHRTVDSAPMVPLLKPAAAKPASKPSAEKPNLTEEFGTIVQQKITLNSCNLSQLGTWIRQNHPKLVPLLGAGKLKKQLASDKRFTVHDNTVSLNK